MNVIKRNGVIEKYNPDKIYNALQKAFVEGKKPFNLKTFQDVLGKMEDNMSIEQIQDLVVKSLFENKQYDIAILYIKYREVQTYKRGLRDKNVVDKMTDVLKNGDFENSNKNSMLPSVTRDIISGVYFRDKVFERLPKDIAEAHRKKTIHWHDSDVDPELTNCCLINLEDMLANGTRINNADIGTPNSIGTAMNISMQIVASVSSQQYGKR